MAEIIKALQEGVDSAGGYLVPEQYVRKLQKLVYARTVAVPEMTKIKMTSDVVKIPKMVAGATGYWVDEGATITESDASFGIIELRAKKVAALTKATTDMLEDNAVNIAQVILDDFTRKLANSIDMQELAGDGTVFKGISYVDATTPSNSATTNLVDAAGNNLGLDHLNSAIKLVLENYYGHPDTLFIHPDKYVDLINLQDSTGRPLFEETLKEGEIGRIKGMKVRVSPNMPTDKVVVGVSGEFGYHGERRPITMRKFYGIEKDDLTFQANTRVGFAIKRPESFAIIHNLG